MPRFQPAPQDDHVGRDFEDFPELASALADLATLKDLKGDDAIEDVPGRLRPEDVHFDDDEDGDSQ